MSYGSCQDPVGNPDHSPELPYSSKARALASGSVNGGDPARVAAVGSIEVSIPEPNLAFHSVSYTIPPAFFSTKQSKIILDSVR